MTLAGGSEAAHRANSSLSICSAISLIMGLLTRMAFIRSFSRLISLFCSLIWNCCSWISRFKFDSLFCCDWIKVLSSRAQLCSFNSSFGTTRPHPFSQGVGLFGLNSHSSRCELKLSSLITAWQPYTELSQEMHRRAKRFLNILGAACNCKTVVGVRSNGHVGCRLIHSLMQTLQNACSQSGA